MARWAGTRLRTSQHDCDPGDNSPIPPPARLLAGPTGSQAPDVWGLKMVVKEIDVGASPKRVWDALVQFEGYEAWTQAVRIRGDLKPGGKMDYGILLRRGRISPFYFNLPGNVVALEPLESLSWEAGLERVLHMKFAIHVNPRPDGARVRQSVEISGLMARLIGRHLGRVFGAHFDRISRDLQERFGGGSQFKGRRRGKQPVPKGR